MNKLQRLYIKAQNARHPGYGECSRCGGNWGWKKVKSHPTRVDKDGHELQGLFLFCEECDAIVTPQERWDALDCWKVNCIRQIAKISTTPVQDRLKWMKETLATEFIEYPRDN